MTTAQQLDDYYYDSRFSPPVSPKSLPHGYKRKASTSGDELEVERNNLISNSFKKLRLGKSSLSSSSAGNPRVEVEEADSNIAKHHLPLDLDLDPVGVSYRDSDPQPPASLQYGGPPSSNPSYLPHPGHETDDAGMMSVDDSADRIWVHDLDAEIAEIEAEEARHRGEIQLNDAADQEIGRIHQHLLKGNTTTNDVQSNMQMILYRDPISISVPEEQDAVRKTIIEARQRMREKQAKEDSRHAAPTSSIGFTHHENDEDDGMDID